MPIAKSKIKLEYYKISNHSADTEIESISRSFGTYFIFLILNSINILSLSGQKTFDDFLYSL